MRSSALATARWCIRSASGNVNGVTLGFQENAGQGEAKAEKDGSTYKISGTAVGVDMANPLQPVNKPFEIEVSCP